MADKKGKAKGKGKAKAKGKAKGKGQDRAKTKGKAKGESKGKAKGKSTGKAKERSEGKGKGKSKGKAKDKAKGKGKGKRKAMVQDLGKELGKGEDQEGQAEAKSAEQAKFAAVTSAAQRRWKQVAARLGLEEQIAAVAAWDGSGTPPILTGFSFVRHVESDARDLVCAGSSVTMTQGVIVERQDGRSFLTGRGVAAKFLGLQVPWKDRANAGQRALSTQERLELGQPEAQGDVRPT